ncbi:MAG: chemotaxis protein CheW [Burkholderiaceae bacterium]|jgi:purine-binding chemotaxis protein CheW
MQSNLQSQEPTLSGHAGILQSGREFLTFLLDGQEYGIEILKVKEIRGYGPVTTIVNAPAYLKGVVDLRGLVVPIVDLRIGLKVGIPSYNAQTVVIILSISTRTIGIVVDQVCEVVSLTADQIRRAPEMGSTVNTDQLLGIGQIDERSLMLMDMERVLSSDAIGLLTSSRE